MKYETEGMQNKSAVSVDVLSPLPRGPAHPWAENKTDLQKNCNCPAFYNFRESGREGKQLLSAFSSKLDFQNQLVQFSID